MSPTVPSQALRIRNARIPCFAFDLPSDLARHVARMVATIIRERNALGQNAVLGLPTGSTPTGVYRELVRMHVEEGLDFSHVVTFNLDEYYGLGPQQLQSYHRWMHEHFFNHVNVPAENIHIPNGLIPLDQVERYCQEYEQQIARAGGLDVVILGIGSNGHIGFNEPFGARNSRTRLCTLDPESRRAVASDFFGEANVPTQAITMGLGTILSSRKILLLALGEHKSRIIRATVEGGVTERVPASYLQDHADAVVLVDRASAKDLTEIDTPWQAGHVDWTDSLTKRAVLWLCQKTRKACLKLAEDDFREHHLHSLLVAHGPVDKLCQKVFGWMMDTIEYHPAGVAAPSGEGRKRVICFSPHPDDDVISMGGTLIRLNQDGHEVHVAYMTSGNIAVFDHDAHRVADFVAEYNRIFGIERKHSQRLEAEVRESLAAKQPGDADSEAVRQIKTLIRWSEAKYGAYVAGCREQDLHFLDLPFYRTGTIAKNPVGPEDVAIIRALIEKVQPDQIYVAGDLSDPHGTHRVCAEAIFAALHEIQAAHGRRPDVLLYRGAWQEYALDEIEIAVPLRPEDLRRKRQAIYMHESQKDDALFPGTDPRQFWQRAEDRNKATADRYNEIGLPEFFAIEAFVRWNGLPI